MNQEELNEINWCPICKKEIDETQDVVKRKDKIYHLDCFLKEACYFLNDCEDEEIKPFFGESDE